MAEINFNTLPQQVHQISEKLEHIERLLLAYKPDNQPETDRWFDINELCKYHPAKPAKSTVYTWTRERRIPFHKKGKALAFLKSEIDEDIRLGKIKSALEIEQQVDNYFATKKRRN